MPANGVLRSLALTVPILTAVVLCSCAGPVPPVPTPQVAGFDPEVRDAIVTAHQQAAADPSSAQASGRLGMVLQAHAVYQPDLLAYERAIRLEPKEFAWRYYLAVVYQQLSESERALAALSAALRIRPDYAPAALRKGDLLFQLGRLKESGDLYKSLLSEDPGSAMALYGMARVKFAEGDLSGAEDFYSRACRAYQTFGAAYYGLATTERRLGKDAQATRDFDLAQRYAADHPPASDSIADQVSAMATGVYYRLAQGDQFARKGRIEEAAQLNEALLKKDPENFTVLLNLLYLARFLDRFDGQLDDLYSKAKRINPQVPLIYDYYGAAMARQGKYDAATAALRRAVELRSDYPEAHAQLGEILERQSRPDEAIAQYRLALAQGPDRAVQMNLWRLLIIHGQGREVIPALLEALPIEDMYSALRLVLIAEAYHTTGDAAKARQYLEQARNRVRQEGPPALLAQIDQELAQVTPRP